MRLGLSSGLSTGGFVPSFTNAYSVAFDGTNDYASTSADDTIATKTYSFWSKSTKTGQQAIFSHGGDNRGTFAFNWSSSKPILYLGDNYRFFDAISQQSDGNWHHWLVYLPAPGGSSDITASKLYCDGSEVSVDSTVSGGSDRSYTSGIQIGFTSSKFFDGNLDEFAIFDGDKTGIVSTLYNDGIPADLTGLSGLEHWWRMGDNDGGTGTTVTDQAGDNNATLENGAAFESEVPA